MPKKLTVLKPLRLLRPATAADDSRPLGLRKHSPKIPLASPPKRTREEKQAMSGLICRQQRGGRPTACNWRRFSQTQR